jgi:hypothetical protein
MPQRLAILVGANPRVIVNGPTCRLYAGNWNLFARGLVDTQLILERKDSISVTSHILHKEEVVEIQGNCTIQVHLGRRGTEDSINVYAELIEYGTNTPAV